MALQSSAWTRSLPSSTASCGYFRTTTSCTDMLKYERIPDPSRRRGRLQQQVFVVASMFCLPVCNVSFDIPLACGPAYKSPRRRKARVMWVACGLLRDGAATQCAVFVVILRRTWLLYVIWRVGTRMSRWFFTGGCKSLLPIFWSPLARSNLGILSPVGTSGAPHRMLPSRLFSRWSIICMFFS